MTADPPVPLESRRGERLTLADGAEVEIRGVERSDRAALASAMARLSDRSRYLRFASAKPTLSERELDALTQLDRHTSDTLLAIGPVAQDIVGVARFAALPDEPRVVDVAVSIGSGAGVEREFELALTHPHARRCRTTAAKHSSSRLWLLPVFHTRSCDRRSSSAAGGTSWPTTSPGSCGACRSSSCRATGATWCSRSTSTTSRASAYRPRTLAAT
jgi:hypothetical protein